MHIRSKEQFFETMRSNSKHLAGFGVKGFGLFGSFVRSEQNDSSEIDILVDSYPEKKSFTNFMNLAFFHEDLLGRKVDLVTRESLSPYLGPKILADVEYETLD